MRKWLPFKTLSREYTLYGTIEVRTTWWWRGHFLFDYVQVL